ncbi:otefin isoform X1 [Rhagoletis pomonella]|uniref:otefin isoform X1 n=1 Tax=Rhagoletis pomonella TaxID=28610 RepID=UPI00177B8B43|nr:otefin isoform X1 [Rhagoletis pomonella]
MSEIDNLESLSNADLRKKCIQHGLPNVPITDSSRNLLIRKLRASLSGSPAASSPKKTSRRETIHVSKTTESAEVKDEVKVDSERRTPSRGPSRRTIAGTPTLDLQKPSESQATDTIVPAPIGTRRRSTRDHEIPPSQKDNKPSKTSNPVYILESDEEDNNLILAAVQELERSKQKPVAKEVNARSRSSRSVSLSKTGVVTTSYSQATAKPLPEVPEPFIFQVSNRNLTSENLPHGIYKPQINVNSGRYSLHPNLTQRTNIGLSKEVPSISRYSTNTLTSGLYTSKATPLYNEQSDDNEEADKQDFETPFLSSFARNLERLKSDGVVLGKPSVLGTTDFGGEYSSPRPIQRSKRYDIIGRRPARDSVTESFRQLLIALDRKYNLRLYLILATIFLVLAFIYVILYQ